MHISDGSNLDERIRIGVVNFINTLPLIDGLESLSDVELHYAVPSRLIDLLLQGEADVALCSSIDYQRSPDPMSIVPAGLLGCDGPTLTVRLYSARPIEQIQVVYCDTDSHTSVALMQVLLRELYDLDPELIDYDAREHVAENRPLDWPETMLLIGDKVVTDSPPAVRYPHQLDLGARWTDHTALPFVFAVWLARGDSDPLRIAAAAAILDRQRRCNEMRLDSIVHHRAKPRKWPADLASSYLKGNISYTVTPRRLEGLELFFRKAEEHGLIEHRRPLELSRIATGGLLESV